MFVLILGLALWVAAHVFKRVAPAKRASLGEAFKGRIALILFLSVALMIVGYRMADTIHLWGRPGWTTPVNNILMVLALYFTTPGPKKGVLFHNMRHPMLFGFMLWVVAHLLVNGDLASLILFGGLGLWAVTQLTMINRAEPEFTGNPKGSIAKDAMFFGISILLVGVIGYIHTLFGLTPFGG